MSSSLNFLANNINPFIGRFGLFSSFPLPPPADPDAPVPSFFFAGDMGGDISAFPPAFVMATEVFAGNAEAEEGVSRGEC